MDLQPDDPLGQAEFSEAGVQAAVSAYRPDIYRAALGDANAPGDADIRIEGQEEGTVSWMVSFSIRPILRVTSMPFPCAHPRRFHRPLERRDWRQALRAAQISSAEPFILHKQQTKIALIKI